MSTTYTHISTPQRSQGYMEDNTFTMSKYSDEVLEYAENVSDHLASGETISTVTLDANGPTLSSEANTTTTFTFKIQYTGSVTATVVTSDSNTIIYKYRWRAIDNPVSDYT